MQKLFFWLMMVLMAIASLLGRKWRNARMVLIDNPTGSVLAFTLDGKEHSLQPLTQMTVSLPDGEHTLVIEDQSHTFYKTGFIFPDSFDALVDSLNFDLPLEILNPSASRYVLGHQIYTDGTLSEETISALRPTYPCPAQYKTMHTCFEEYIDELYFERVVDYDLDTPFPEQMKLPRSKKYELRSKLFRAEEYMQH